MTKSTVIYRAEKIVSPTLGLIEDGAIIVETGKIKAVGKANKLKKFKSSEEHDFGHASIFPGFIEAHGHITIVGDGTGSIGEDSNDYFDPIVPHLKISDSINLDTPELKVARNEGIVAVAIFPGSANLIGGMGTMIRTTRDTLVVKEAIIKEEIGLKMAFGENPKRIFSSERKFHTRMGALGFLRDYFNGVLNYKRKKEHHDPSKDNNQPIDINLKFEVGLNLLQRKFPARAHAHQANDIQNAIKLSEEFGFDLVIEHGTEADLIIDYLHERKIPIVLGPIVSPGLKIETRRRSLDSAGKLARHGILTAIMTDAPVYNISLLRLLTGLSIKGGMDYWDALKAISLNAAKICRIDDAYGDIRPGIEPHLVVREGDPLRDIQSRVVEIID